MGGRKQMSWTKLKDRERGQQALVEEARLRDNYSKVINEPTLKMEVAALRRFNATQARKIAARGGPRVQTLTAIYSDKGTRIKLPSKAAAFILWREAQKHGGT